MNFINATIAVLGVILITYSCKPKIENNETKTIDSLLIALNVAEEKLESINFDKLEQSAETAKENLEKIKPLINDTLNRDKLFLMSNYAIVSGEEGEQEAEKTNKNKSESFDEEREKYIEKEVKFCIKQLKNLKRDFMKGEMDLVTFKKYFQVEKAKTDQIILYIEMEENSSKYRQALFDSLQPLMIKFIDSLQTVASKK